MADEIPNARTRITALIGVVIVFGITIAHALKLDERYLHMRGLHSRDLLWWGLMLALLIYIVAIERRPLSSIGLRWPTWRTLAFGAATAALLFALEPLIAMAMAHFHLNPQAGSKEAHILLSQPYWYRVEMVTRAAIVEEVIFRGYAIERLIDLTGSRTTAAIIATAVFVFAHLSFWGWVPLIGVSVAGTLLALLYIWRRDLIANMIAHFVIDGVGLLL